MEPGKDFQATHSSAQPNAPSNSMPPVAEVLVSAGTRVGVMASSIGQLREQILHVEAHQCIGFWRERLPGAVQDGAGATLHQLQEIPRHAFCIEKAAVVDCGACWIELEEPQKMGGTL